MVPYLGPWRSRLPPAATATAYPCPWPLSIRLRVRVLPACLPRQAFKLSDQFLPIFVSLFLNRAVTTALMEDQHHQHTMVDSSDTNMDSSTCTMDSSAPSSIHGGESREQSPPVQADPLLPHPPEYTQLKRSASSRLPVPRKSFVPAPIAVPPPYGSLRPAPSKEFLVSTGPKSASPRIPSLTKRPSKLGGLKSPNAIDNRSKYSTPP